VAGQSHTSKLHEAKSGLKSRSLLDRGCVSSDFPFMVELRLTICYPIRSERLHQSFTGSVAYSESSSDVR
jgi:hypothetical protein